MGEIVSRTERIKDGEATMEEGAWAFYAYLLKSGKAKVYRTIEGCVKLAAQAEETVKAIDSLSLSLMKPQQGDRIST